LARATLPTRDKKIARIGDSMSLVKNIRNAQKKGTAKSKKNSTVSPSAYKDMQKGWPKKGKKKKR
tara:strand:- start:1704 stop:1898 length:195 start_codon:yes stop_codon:yes gene_type:complete